ncbi:MAG: type secretion system sortase PorU, partial [Bacteroidota bacterium]
MSRINQFIALSVFILLSPIAQAVSLVNANSDVIQSSTAKRAAANSVLANGQWLKISVTQDGIYKLDAQWFQTQGIDISKIDPRTIQLYSHQGGMLSELNAVPRPNDLPENAILVTGESDGKFDANDYVLFYAQSPNVWQFDPTSKRFKHQIHFYSEKTYLFLTYGQTSGKRVSSKSDGMSLTPDSTFNWFNYHEFHESEKENICREGRVHLGEKFDQVTSYTFNHTLPNIISNQTAKLYYQVASNATIASNLVVKIDGVNKDVNSFYPLLVPTNCFESNGERQVAFTPNQNFQLEFQYNKLNSSCRAWLDYYELHASRSLDYAESFMPFANINSLAVNTTAYQLKNIANAGVIWDVTNPVSPAIQAYQTIG